VTKLSQRLIRIQVASLSTQTYVLYPTKLRICIVVLREDSETVPRKGKSNIKRFVRDDASHSHIQRRVKACLAGLLGFGSGSS
jgi:hypothetical protein